MSSTRRDWHSHQQDCHVEAGQVPETVLYVTDWHKNTRPSMSAKIAGLSAENSDESKENSSQNACTQSANPCLLCQQIGENQRNTPCDRMYETATRCPKYLLYRRSGTHAPYDGSPILGCRSTHGPNSISNDQLAAKRCEDGNESADRNGGNRRSTTCPLLGGSDFRYRDTLYGECDIVRIDSDTMLIGCGA